MGLFGSNKEKKNPREVYEPEIKEFLLEGEEIEEIYGLILDFLCFTNKRLIFVDKDISFKYPKTTMYSIPYDKITGVGLVKNERAFAFTDKIILATRAGKYDLTFIKGTNIKEVYNKLVEKTL